MGLKKPIFIGAIGTPRLPNQHHLSRAWRTPNRIWANWGIMPALIPDPRQYVLVSPKSINMQFPSTKNTSQTIRSTAMSQISHGQTFLILNCFVGDSPVSPFQSQENGVGSLIPVVHSFLKSQGLHRKNSHAFYFLKTLKGFYLTTKAVPSELASIRWMNLGMTSNGKCLTLKTSASPKTENASSLSDILEPQVAPKYFLSMGSEWVKRIQRAALHREDMGAKGTALMLNRTPKQTSRIHSPRGISPTIPTSSGGRHIPMICESDDSPQPNVNDSKDSQMDGQKQGLI